MLIGGWHLLWAVSLALDWSQYAINSVLWMHFIKPVYVVGPFDLGIAGILIVITTFVGFLVAYIFSMLWNRLHVY